MLSALVLSFVLLGAASVAAALLFLLLCLFTLPSHLLSLFGFPFMFLCLRICLGLCLSLCLCLVLLLFVFSPLVLAVHNFCSLCKVEFSEHVFRSVRYDLRANHVLSLRVVLSEGCAVYICEICFFMICLRPVKKNDFSKLHFLCATNISSAKTSFYEI